MRKWLAGLIGRPDARAEAAELFARGAWAQAAGALRRVLAADPMDAEAWNKLGFACKELGNIVEASRCFQRTVELVPESPGALSNAASALRDLGQADEALSLLRRARARAPEDLDLLSACVFTMNFSTRLGREEIFREHLECERLLGRLPRLPAPPPVPAGAKVKLAYLSPDLRFHAVACFVEPLLMHHDRSRFEVGCYYLHPRRDAVSERLAGLADRWVDCAGWPPEALAQRIRADGVDLLVDLAGHTDWNALPALAFKPARVSATWLGYLNTTGLRAVDYRITDAYADPPGLTERFHTEKLARLPGSQWCRLPPAFAPEVSPLPALRSGAVCFGSFNKSAKLTAATLELWAALLRRLPTARLLFAGIERALQERLAQTFAAQGVLAERLEFFPRLPLEEFLALHDKVDIALDPHPYSGATTTLDSLWMGVPVLTLAGEAPMSRSSASILSALGLQDWIADSGPSFLDTAARQAGGLDLLARLRARLRPALQASSVMDAEAFTRRLETLYFEMLAAPRC